MAPFSGPPDDSSWPQLSPESAPPNTPSLSKNPQSGPVPRSSDPAVDSRDLSRNNNESTGVGPRRATTGSGPMPGARLSYSDMLRKSSPRESNGTPDARPAAIPSQQLRMESTRPAERRITAVPAAQSSSHQTVARHDSSDGQVRVHIVKVLAFCYPHHSFPRGSPPIVKTTGKVVPRSPCHLPVHLVYPLGKPFLPHLRRETYGLFENHKIWAAIPLLVLQKPKARREILNLPPPRSTHPAPNESTPPVPPSRLRNPLPILRHLQANWAPLRLRHHLTRPQP